MTRHLWEIDHPYYGADGPTNHCDSFAELRHTIDRLDEDMNHVYRWDWTDYTQPHHDDLFLEDEYRGGQHFQVFLVLPRKSTFISFRCPITHDQEAEVLAWLRGPRILGALATLWAPLIDAPRQPVDTEPPTGPRCPKYGRPLPAGARADEMHPECGAELDRTVAAERAGEGA